MFEVNLSDLPDEILENIFKRIKGYHGPKTIKNLTEVCSRFNNLISRNMELTRNLTVRYWGSKQKDINSLSASKRKYQSISVTCIDQINKDLLKFLNINPITKISIKNSSIKTKDLYKLLKIVSNNVKSVNLEDLDLVKADDEKFDPIDFPKLEVLRLYELDCKEMSSIFVLFTGATNVKEFKYNDKHELNEAEAFKFSEMLASLDGLKKLELTTFIPYFFNDDYLATNAKFQLKSFYHDSSDGDYGNDEFYPMDFRDQLANGCVHLTHFLNGQRACLETIRISRYPITSEVINSILLMEKLTFLCMQKSNFRSRGTVSVKNMSIKSLYIGQFTNHDMEYNYGGTINRDTEVGITNIIMNCPNVEDLHLSDFEITSGISMSIALYMKNLEKISFMSHYRIYPVTFASVKTMDLTFCQCYDYDYDCYNYNDFIKLLQLNQQIKILHLPVDIDKHPNYAATMAMLNLDRLEVYPF